MQKNDTAVRVTHLPTGIVVYREDSRSQWQNRQSAVGELRRILDVRAAGEAAAAQNRDRVAQVVNDRAAKTFTWNEQRGMVVAHETGEKWRLRDFERGKF